MMRATGETVGAPDAAALPQPRADRPVTLSKRAEHILLLTLGTGLRAIGVDAASAIAGAVCRAVGPRLSKIHARGVANLRLIHPEWTKAQTEETLASAWENIGRTAAEFFHLDKFDPFAPAPRIRINGLERLQAANGAGPVIFFSGHFANWELMAVAMSRAGLDYGLVYRPANNPLIDGLIIRTRAASMTRRQFPKSKYGGRALVETLKAGRSLAMLLDQKYNEGIEVDFMGRPAMTAPAAARLSLKFNAPLTPIGIRRIGGAKFEMDVREPVAFTPSGDADRDVAALTARINEALAAEIAAAPGQWLWFHRRWPDASRPQGETSRTQSGKNPATEVGGGPET